MKKSREGEFREDLFYRLNVFPITVPPLRKRGNDVGLIANVMLQHFGKKLGKSIEALNEGQLQLFKSYAWPGNVRELQNLLERAVIISKKGVIDWQTIIPHTKGQDGESLEANSDEIFTSQQMAALERENIKRALKRTNWRISGEKGAATLLNIPSTTLSSKIKALGIHRHE
ncbi:response regulator receiver protein [Moorena producens 3L]|uniref:Response regulator receiver protein n=1 Tax=Moorena producens 3L TaxID=489825 RepID=F4XS81_9CYAN|nr:response regulator receiver protein [Moorena producens 3L]